MRAVCAWCGTTLEEGDPGDGGVSHGICPACSRAWSAGLAGCVVLPSQRSFLLPGIQQAFREIRDLRVIVDRRLGERRRERQPVSRERRASSRDRRQRPGLIVGAIPCVGGFWFPMQGGQAPAGRPLSAEAAGGPLPPERPRGESPPHRPSPSPEDSR
jgi:hypothetical protein